MIICEETEPDGCSENQRRRPIKRGPTLWVSTSSLLNALSRRPAPDATPANHGSRFDLLQLSDTRTSLSLGLAKAAKRLSANNKMRRKLESRTAVVLSPFAFRQTSADSALPIDSAEQGVKQIFLFTQF